MVQSYPEPPNETAGIGSVMGDIVSAFGGVSKEFPEPGAQRRNGFSSDQLYLLTKLNRRAEKPLSFGGLTKLNQAYGEWEVTEAMRDATLAENLGSVYAYVQSVCTGQGSLA